MKTREKIMAFGALVLIIAMTACSKESIRDPFPKGSVATVIPEEEGTQISVSGEVYTFDIAYKFPTTQLVLKFPSILKEEMGSREVRAYLIGTADGNLYQVPGFDANGDHIMKKSNNNAETVIEFFSTDGNPYSVPFGVYREAKIILVGSSQQ